MMWKNKSNVLYTTLLLTQLLVSCRKDSPIVYSPPISDTIKNITFIEENDIYFLECFNCLPVKLTNSSQEEKTAVRISHSGTQIAYLTEQGALKVLSIHDSTVITIESNGVKDFNWSADDNTVYYLKNEELFFYGPELTIPELSIPEDAMPGGSPQYHSASISPEADLAYTLTWTTYLSESEIYYDQYFIRKSHDGQHNVVIKEFSPIFKSVRYTGFNQDLVLTTTWNYFENTKYYADFSEEIPFAWDPNIEFPIYNSNGDYLMGFKKDPSDPAKFNLVLQNSAGTIIRKNTKHSFSLDISDLDWKVK